MGRKLQVNLLAVRTNRKPLQTFTCKITDHCFDNISIAQHAVIAMYFN